MERSCCPGWVALLYSSCRGHQKQWEKNRGLLPKALPAGRTESARKHLEGGKEKKEGNKMGKRRKKAIRKLGTKKTSAVTITVNSTNLFLKKSESYSCFSIYKEHN